MKHINTTIEQRILNLATAKKDFTINLNKKDSKNRYIVGCNPLYIGHNPSLQYDLISTIKTNINIDLYDSIGGWYDEYTKLYYLDMNFHIEDITFALKWAAVNKQLAIYDQQEKQVLCLNKKDMKTYKVTVTETATKWYNESSELHRENGPAIEWANGDKFYFVNGKLHRENGPAVKYVIGSIGFENGDKFYYINGEELTKQEFKARDSKTVII